MLPSRPIVGFFLKFVLLYGLLMVFWPTAYNAYGPFFRAGGELVFKVFWSTDVVRFEELPQQDRASENETRVFVERRGSQGARAMSICARDIGYLSTVVLIALVVATPIPWSRRVRALLWGTLLLHGVIALRLAILVAAISSLNNPNPLLMQDSFWSRAMQAAVLRLSLGQPIAYIVSVLIWMLVSLRREDLSMILGPSDRHRA